MEAKVGYGQVVQEIPSYEDSVTAKRGGALFCSQIGYEVIDLSTNSTAPAFVTLEVTEKSKVRLMVQPESENDVGEYALALVAFLSEYEQVEPRRSLFNVTVTEQSTSGGNNETEATNATSSYVPPSMDASTAAELSKITASVYTFKDSITSASSSAETKKEKDPIPPKPYIRKMQPDGVFEILFSSDVFTVPDLAMLTNGTSLVNETV